jgi:hypothetical protein
MKEKPSWMVVRVSGLAGAVLLAVACGGDVLPLQGDVSGAGAGGSGGTAVTGGSSGKASGGGGKGGTGGDGVGAEGGVGEAGTGGGTTVPDPNSVSLVGSPLYTRFMRLTVAQWERAVTDILRLDPPPAISRDFVRPVEGTTDFTNNEKLLFVDQQALPEFELGAETAAALATATPEALERVYSGTDAEGFIRVVGRRALRRPLTPEEELRYQRAFASGEAIYGEGFANGAALVIRALLQSPHFLYRTELGDGGEPLTGYEVASKLSFWLRGTTPSDALLDAAASGELDTLDGVEAAARAMLDEASALAVMRDFHGQLHHLARLQNVEKPGVPEYDPAFNVELEQAAYAFFDRVFDEGSGLGAILTSRNAFVGPALAPLYGIEAAPSTIEAQTLDSVRAGFFRQVPFLLLHGVDDEPDTIARGVALARDVLCIALEPAPSESPPLPPLEPGQTNRERIESLTADCGGACHASFEPLGLSLEDFDGMGRHRDTDNGSPVNTAGVFSFADGTENFPSGSELMQIMADGTQAHTCYAKKLSSYALQRDIVERDRPFIDALAVVSADEGSLKEMVISLVKDPAFRNRQDGVP